MLQPSLFLSHGAPDIALRKEHPTHDFFKNLPSQYPKPDAIVVFSAHWCTDSVMISGNTSFRAIYDFGGFDAKLYSMQYAPQGNPELAATLLTLLKNVDRDAKVVETPGLDHGVWIPLSLMYPKADIPVVAVSMQPQRSTDYHVAIGESLAALRKQNVLLIGSGALTHNLSRLMLQNHDAAPPAWVVAFAEWMRSRLENGDKHSVRQYRELAPYARENHPTVEHILPLFVAMGSGSGAIPKRIHTAASYGTVMMDAYVFGDLEGKAQ